MAKSPEEEHPHKAFGWAAKDSSGVLSPFHFSRRLLLSLCLWSFFFFFFFLYMVLGFLEGKVIRGWFIDGL
jgi:cinnamyl-alcohol dehydrogenase